MNKCTSIITDQKGDSVCCGKPAPHDINSIPGINASFGAATFICDECKDRLLAKIAEMKAGKQK